MNPKKWLSFRRFELKYWWWGRLRALSTRLRFWSSVHRLGKDATARDRQQLANRSMHWGDGGLTLAMGQGMGAEPKYQIRIRQDDGFMLGNPPMPRILFSSDHLGDFFEICARDKGKLQELIDHLQIMKGKLK